MPTARRTRTIAAPADELWQTIRDPHHLPRWWPRVSRVEDVTEDAFTEVLSTSGGKSVRADFTLVELDEHDRRLRWAQRVEGNPFARLLKSAETEVWLRDAAGVAGAQAVDYPSASGEDRPEGSRAPRGGTGTEVTIELRQTLNGFFSRFGAYMVKRAATNTIEEALDGLERIGG
jgi:uncharacterized protein YndB with AHSA1/START domain